MSEKLNNGLENLVPPLELCKLIPSGEFKDSAFAWWQITPFEEWQVVVRSTLTTIPAPTLEELIITLADMTPYAVKICKSFNEWHVECCIAQEYGERYISADSSKNPATAALKLWLELKGIEA